MLWDSDKKFEKQKLQQMGRQGPGGDLVLLQKLPGSTSPLRGVEMMIIDFELPPRGQGGSI